MEINVINSSRIQDNKVQAITNTISKGLEHVSFSEYKESLPDLTWTVKLGATDNEVSLCDKLSEKIFILYSDLPSEIVESISFKAKLRTIQFVFLNTSIDFDGKIVLVLSNNKSNATTNDDTKDEDEAKRRSAFVPQEPKVSLDKVVMSDENRENIEDALSAIKNRKKIYEDWGFQETDPNPKSILNFWGPPGTGKTMCAHGIAKYLNTKILVVKLSDIESKWLGESPKNLAAAFDVAKECKAVMFFDEADSFLGKRVTSIEHSADQALNSLRSQMLIHLEDFEGVAIFATNLKENIDKAFETRIVKHIEFELPDEDGRFKIFKKLIPSKCPLADDFNDNSLRELAKESDKLSGRDIRTIILNTLSNVAKQSREVVTKNDFLKAIKFQRETYDKLNNESSYSDSQTEDEIKDAIRVKAIRDINGAIINLALHFAWIDGSVNTKEEQLIKNFTKGLVVDNEELNLEIKCTDQNVLTPLFECCDKINSPEYKNKTIELLCRIIAVNDQFSNAERKFLTDLIDRLKMSYLGIDKVMKLIEEMVDTFKKFNGFFEKKEVNYE